MVVQEYDIDDEVTQSATIREQNEECARFMQSVRQQSAPGAEIYLNAHGAAKVMGGFARVRTLFSEYKIPHQDSTEKWLHSVLVSMKASDQLQKRIDDALDEKHSDLDAEERFAGLAYELREYLRLYTTVTNTRATHTYALAAH